MGGVDGGGGAGSPSDRNGGVTTNNDGQVAGAGGEGGCIVEDSDLDAVLNSALVLGLGERVAGIQQRNARLLQASGLLDKFLLGWSGQGVRVF